MPQTLIFEWVIGSNHINEAPPQHEPFFPLEIVDHRPFMVIMDNDVDVPPQGENWLEEYPLPGRRLVCPVPPACEETCLILMHGANATIIAITQDAVAPDKLLDDYQSGLFALANYITIPLPQLM